ncbi:MAG TPA: biotin--[acetyl-CoA-carboxylase] ligase [Mycobacteriales bacterium]|nr:biotin--[acetyl-CoA-carboxylase] ligase [Mycobacteriales bacterium]
MPSRWSDLDRPPLSAVRLNHALTAGPVWREIRVVEATGSTNADVAEAARSGAAEGLVVIAEEQRTGRGRLDRQWSSPPRAGVTLSALLRPDVASVRWPLIPLLAGLSVVAAFDAVAHVEAGLKWPNDVLIGGRKVAGILVERVADAVVVGIGINVSTRPEELPVDTATSLAIEGAATDREIVVREVLRRLADRYRDWLDTAGDPGSILTDYRRRCETIGSPVEVQLPGGAVARGVATRIEDGGGLVVQVDGCEERTFLAGDVTHVRRVS